MKNETTSPFPLISSDDAIGDIHRLLQTTIERCQDSLALSSTRHVEDALYDLAEELSDCTAALRIACEEDILAEEASGRAWRVRRSERPLEV